MSITVKPIDQEFKLVIEHEKEKVEFSVVQLDYRTKSMITSLTTSVKQGQVMVDSILTVFYNLKYGLKKVKGLVDADGKAYKLEFTGADKKQLTDKCLDELLAAPFSDNLQYSARGLSENAFPDVILHPLTKTPLKGVEVIPASKLKGTRKK